ncbi:MAG: FHA domain-containing protein, partial [Gemmatimonadota bacterium]
MPFLRLRDLRTGSLSDFGSAEVRIGRDPELELTLGGEGSHVVSGSHVRFFYRVGRWWIEDTGSRNGTYIGDRRLVPRESEVIAPGTVIRLGKTGPRLRVETAASRALDATFAEQAPEATPAEAPSVPESAGAHPPPKSPIVVKVVLEEARSGERFEAAGA